MSGLLAERSSVTVLTGSRTETAGAEVHNFSDLEW